MRKQQAELFNSLTQYWQKIVDELVQSLYDVGKVASGQTAQNIGAFNPKPVQLTAGGFRIQIAMPDYYQYIDEGVSGAEKNTGISRFKYKSPFSWKNAPPISAIRKFMLNRGIDTARQSNTKSGKRRDAEEIRNGIAFAIARSIWSKGLKRTNFYSNVINDQELLEFEAKLIQQYRKYIIDIVTVD